MIFGFKFSDIRVPNHFHHALITVTPETFDILRQHCKNIDGMEDIPSHQNNRLTNLLHSSRFNAAIGLCILLNLVIIGLEADLADHIDASPAVNACGISTSIKVF
jgi:hypothetical protein